MSQIFREAIETRFSCGKDRVARSSAPQERQGYKHLLDRRMALKMPIRGLRRRLHPRLSHVVHLRRTCSDEQDEERLKHRSKK